MANRGRPQGSFTYHSPITNELCSVYQWRREKRLLKRQKLVSDGEKTPIRLEDTPKQILKQIAVIDNCTIDQITNRAIMYYFENIIRKGIKN